MCRFCARGGASPMVGFSLDTVPKKSKTFKYTVILLYTYTMVSTMQQVLHYPRLDTILKVEKILKTAKEPLSKNEIDRRLETQIMRPTLNLILDYLEQSGKIAVLKEGILWIYSEDISEKLKAKMKRAVTVM